LNIFTFDSSKSDNAINTRILTCFPVFGQIKSNIALKMYRVEISFEFTPASDATPPV
jgi:hypothetical protein